MAVQKWIGLISHCRTRRERRGYQGQEQQSRKILFHRNQGVIEPRSGFCLFPGANRHTYERFGLDPQLLRSWPATYKCGDCAEKGPVSGREETAAPYLFRRSKGASQAVYAEG